MRSRVFFIAGVVFLLNTAYIAAFATPSIFYMGNVVLHLFGGLALTAAAVWWFRSMAAGFLSMAALMGVWIAIVGNTTDHHALLVIHIVLGVAAVAMALVALAGKGKQAAFRILLVTSIVCGIFPFAMTAYRHYYPNRYYEILNPTVVPTSMAGEGAGPKSPFWPSSANTNVNGIIPSSFFMDSALCGECHKDIYRQWKSSMHHFASFNNQFYRSSVLYMQDIAGTKPTKWCAGCHDHAVFFNGRFDRPMKEQIDTPAAQTGLGCMSCHSVVHVDSTMGNGDIVIEYPPLHKLASSHNPILRKIDAFLTYLNPKPHRFTFMKPFMKKQPAQFCSACHKVHLDVPVNNYRWVRGFDDYDNWQASGVSWQGARSFYYPDKPYTCVDCHMPLVNSNDPGNIDGKVHSHRFPAANTAIAYVNHDAAQLKAEEDFLKNGIVTVDIFAASPVERGKGQLEMIRRATDEPQLSSSFAVGEESEQTGPAFIREVGKMVAPIDTAHACFLPGSTIRLDAVVRTRKVGHFFPGGTVDAFDLWLELKAKDATGRTIFWSGKVEDNGRGPVDPSAHFYRSYQLDAHGNMINKRNAFQTRTTLYVHLIPPGAADVVHYRMKIPKDAVGPITVTAKLNYRKFSYYYTQFAYAGEPVGHDPKLVTDNFDDRHFTFTPADIPKDVSGQIKGRIPNLPIVVIAQKTTQFGLGEPHWQPVVEKQDRERWNDYGIGLLLQGDLKGAEYAFKKVTQAEPGYADGWLNVARALIQEGETDEAKPYIAKAMSINDKLGRIWYFKAQIQKTDGDYDGALKSLRITASMYPHDRVVWNDIGRICFLERNYTGAVKALNTVLSIDPENLEAHYNLMLAYRGLDEMAKSAREQKLFQRFKADESAQSITAGPRMLSPENNNERQPIHDHENAQ
jgi:tetratricopeptide (TPR) repeat protein